MRLFMLVAVDATIMPITSSPAPMSATQRRPRRSDNEPTNGHMAASANILPRTNQTKRSLPPISRYIYSATGPSAH